MPKVTVIIPNYNHERFLAKRIQSVLDQTYQDVEIIYLDDASPDNSNQVFAKFTNEDRIRAIYNEFNSGTPFKQWNKGIREAKGEYVWIAESDDYANERLLAELVTKLDENPTVGLAYCQSWKIDENDHILSSWEEWTKDLDAQRWQQDFVNNGKDECSRYLVFKNTIPNASAVLIRRSVYESVGGADENLRVTGDWKLWFKMLMVSDVAFVAEPLNYFRTHANTARSGAIKNNFGNLEEDYRGLGFRLSSLSLTEATINQACSAMAEEWVDKVVKRRGRVGLKRNFQIYQVASEIDPKLGRRLLEKLSLRVLGTIKRRFA